jgi:hypothetical protein
MGYLRMAGCYAVESGSVNRSRRASATACDVTTSTSPNGQVYSGGTISFNPINVNGSSVGFGIDLQATSSTYQYVPDYGIASPPPGFPPGASDPVVLTPKTFIVCNGYHDDSSGATACQ